MTAVDGPMTQIEAAALREALHIVRRRASRRADAAADRRGAVRPRGGDGRQLRTDAPRARRPMPRRAALAIQDLCEGPLRGMFDGPTTPGARPRLQALVLDLHAVKDSPAVGILMACASAWMSALLAHMAERPGRERLINVADESWKIVQHTGLGEWFQSTSSSPASSA